MPATAALCTGSEKIKWRMAIQAIEAGENAIRTIGSQMDGQHEVNDLREFPNREGLSIKMKRYVMTGQQLRSVTANPTN